jgi:hypothetical protein
VLLRLRTRLRRESDSAGGWLCDGTGGASNVRMLEGDLLGRVMEGRERSLLGLLDGGGREHARAAVGKGGVAVGGREGKHHVYGRVWRRRQSVRGIDGRKSTTSILRLRREVWGWAHKEVVRCLEVAKNVVESRCSRAESVECCAVQERVPMRVGKGEVKEGGELPGSLKKGRWIKLGGEWQAEYGPPFEGGGFIRERAIGST